MVRGLGYGDLLCAIAEISKAPKPNLDEVVRAVAELSSAEWDDYGKIVTGRLRGIAALRKIYQKIDFKDSKNEGEIHKLLKANPWLIDATFWQFLTSNLTEKTLSDELSRHLKVDACVPDDYDKDGPEESEPLKKNLRPDLVFILGNYSLGRIVIIELKAPNTPLHTDHLTQLESYMEDVQDFIAARRGTAGRLKVEGYLIGTRARASRADKVRHLARREREAGPASPWRVFDIGELLERAENAHRELLDVYEREAKASPSGTARSG